MIGIYDYEKRLKGIQTIIEESSRISEENKKLIFNFVNDCFANNVGLARIVRYMYSIRDLAVWLDKSFEACNIEDIKKLVADIERMPNYSPRTKYEYRSTLKKFYKWLRKTDAPEEIKWIKLNFKKNNDKLPSELLTEGEIELMINSTQNIRNRAIIMSLYESGCRVGEFLKIRIKEIKFEKPGCIFTVSGKTGGRRVRLISSEPYIIEWLNHHPDADNPEAFLWINSFDGAMLEYASFCKVLRVSAQKANIRKKVNPHSFRHARATYLANRFTEQQLKVFFGWTRSSEMAAVYVHLSGKDVDDALLDTYGIKEDKQESKITKLKPSICGMCNSQNEATNKFCKTCGSILDGNKRNQLIAQETEKEEVDKIMDLVLKDPKIAEMIAQKIKEVKL